MVNTIIDLTAKKLSALPFIEGIVLGGSRARGTRVSFVQTAEEYFRQIEVAGNIFAVCAKY